MEVGKNCMVENYGDWGGDSTVLGKLLLHKRLCDLSRHFKPFYTVHATLGPIIPPDKMTDWPPDQPTKTGWTLK
jgi:hypothetical protein